jgi:subtilisin-like proprotein convertase family protein
MKKRLLLTILGVSALFPAQAALYSAGYVNGGGTSLNLAIPDGNPNGITTSLLVSGTDSSLVDVNVTLNISAGYNGDLYAYLVNPNGTMVVLLNRVGTGTGSAIQSAFGYSTAGFNNVTLDDAATGGSIHNMQNPGSLPTVSYTPDGGNLSAFDSGNPNGTWTLFFADLSAGNTSILNGWSLDITAVPEPVNVAMVIFGVGFIGTGVVRSYRGSKKATIPPAADLLKR